MIRRLAHMIGLVVLLAPAVAQAQTNLDQGKSPAQIFAAACAECHKAPRGLANGKSTSALTDFLREHYTTSRDQAAALAAYVLTGRNTDPGTFGARGQDRGQDRSQEQKPTPERGATADRGTAATEEPKPSEPKPSEPKPSKRQARQSKPDEAAPPEAKVEAKPDTDIISVEQPSAPARTRHKDQKTQPAAVAPVGIAHAPAAAPPESERESVPAPAVVPAHEASPPAEQPAPAPTAGASGDEPVPRDNIPD